MLSKNLVIQTGLVLVCFCTITGSLLGDFLVGKNRSVHCFGLRLTLSATLFVAMSLIQVSAADQDSGAAKKKTIGLVLTSWRTAVYESGDVKAECPAGFHFDNQENFEKQYSTPEARTDFARQYLYLGPGNIGTNQLVAEQYLLMRGPNGTNVGWNPTSVVDPLPLRLVQSKTAYGLNLDGTPDGKATPKSCKHDKFVSPNGEQGIDNQLYRILGCSTSWRKGGHAVEFHQTEFTDAKLNRVLIEISNIDDEKNSDNVIVTFYKGTDAIPMDAVGNRLPWQSYRMDVRFPQHIGRARGKIVNGVLETEPIDQYFALSQHTFSMERYLRGMRVRLNLADKTASAEGFIAGYEDLARWYENYARSYSPHVNQIVLWSPPALYAAAQQLADGYPDPKTGQCTAISAAYQVNAVRALIVRPGKDDPLVADGALKL